MRRLIIWGGFNQGLDSFRHIHRHFFYTARKLGIAAHWVNDDPVHHELVTPGSVVLTVDVWNKHVPIRDEVDYVVHNYSADHELFHKVDKERILRLQVYTHDAFGEVWDNCRLYSKEHRILFQPWGTDLLAEEFMEPVYNGMSREAVYVGAIWSDVREGVELGNEGVIEYLKNCLARQGLVFKHYTHISDAENVAAVRRARLAPTITGNWQAEHGYIPCRAFKNPSYGQLMFTNNPEVNKLFGSATVPGDTIMDVVDNTLRLRKKDYEQMVVEQQRVAARYSYRESLQAISRALGWHW